MTTLTPTHDRHEMLLRISELRVRLTAVRFELVQDNDQAAATICDEISAALRVMAMELRQE